MCYDKIDVIGIISGLMDKKMFDFYVEGIFVLMLCFGDVVIFDNFFVYRSIVVVSILKDIGVWFLFLFKYSFDLNFIEMVFLKFKVFIRKVVVRIYDDFW